ncbi:MAG: hypothetical protein EA357_04215 [Micavibrio sp.]|nr:MAG: hypothetical protein EA357_04215 [Micavibrio sp.]
MLNRTQNIQQKTNAKESTEKLNKKMKETWSSLGDGNIKHTSSLVRCWHRKLLYQKIKRRH